MSNVYGVSVPGCEGRAGMAAFSLEDADNFNWTAFSEHVENTERLKIIDYKHDILVLVVPEYHPLVSKLTVKIEDFIQYEMVGLEKGSSLQAMIDKQVGSGQDYKLFLITLFFLVLKKMFVDKLGWQCRFRVLK